MKSGELRDGVVHQAEESITEAALATSSAKLFPAGTVCIALYGATVGRLGILSIDASTNQAVCGIFRTNAILPWFLFRFLQLIRQQLVELGKGGAQPNISQSIVRQIRVPVAPIIEQQRILDEIDKQFTRLDAAVAALRRVQANLKRYCAAVLKAACEGRLVPAEAELARREGRSYEPASVLLQRILAERRARWEAAHIAKFRARGKEPIGDGWKSKYEAPTSRNVSNEPALPGGWTWATLSQLAWNADYGTSEKCDHGWPGPPVLRIPNIVNGRIDLKDLKHAKEGNIANGTEALDPGDLLIIRTNGSRDLIGRSAVIRERFETPHYYASYLIRYRLVPKLSLLSWLQATWNSPSYRSKIEALAATSAGQYNVSISKLNSFLVPLPPESEMIRIADEVDRRLSILEELEVQVNDDLSRSDRLRQAILTRAFKGKLVPQEPDDEPASVLLDRICADRNAAHKGAPATSQRRRKKEATHVA